jgi:hypothetical protein
MQVSSASEKCNIINACLGLRRRYQLLPARALRLAGLADADLPTSCGVSGEAYGCDAKKEALDFFNCPWPRWLRQ